MDGDAAVAVSLLGAHGVLQDVARGGLGHPLGGFAVGAHQKRAGALLHDPVGQQRRAAQGHGARGGHGIAKRGDPVQVRVHGDHGVEQAGEKGADDSLAHGLARVEGDVLAHIGQVGRHQRELAHAQAARTARGEQQLDEFFIGLVQAAQQHGACGQLARGVHGQGELELAIWEAVARDLQRRKAAGGGQAGGGGAFAVEVQQAGRGGVGRGHAQNSTNTWGTSSALPMR